VPYRQVFAAPGTVTVAAAGVVARTAHFMTVLGVVLFVAATTGSYGLAGAVSAAYALAYAAVSPVTSRLVDRHGPRRVLVPAVSAHLGARAAMLVAAWWPAPGWAVVTLAAAAGATMPAVGPLARARWSALYRGTALLHPALSFESVMDEAILVVGPVAVTVLATSVDPAAGLVAALVLAAGGLGTLAVTAGPMPPVAATGTAPPGAGLLAVVALVATVSAATVTIEVTVVAFAAHRGVTGVSGWVLASMALSSTLCGLWYGARRWRRPPAHRLMWTLSLFAVASLGFAAAPDVGALFGAAVLCGLTLAPLFIDAFATVHDLVPAHRLTEGLTWMSTAGGTGIAVGSAMAGQAIDAWGTTATFALASGCAAGAVPMTRVIGRQGDQRRRHHHAP
jgi:MFS family permease